MTSQRSDKPSLRKLLQELYENTRPEWDDDNDGCRFCSGNVVIGGVREVVAAAKENREYNISPHDDGCIYRRVGEALENVPDWGPEAEEERASEPAGLDVEALTYLVESAELNIESGDANRDEYIKATESLRRWLTASAAAQERP